MLLMITPIPKDHYVYVHYQGLTPVYVGKGHKGRVMDYSKREYKWDGYRILEDGLTSSEAFELEKLVQETYGYENLINNKHSDFESKRRADLFRSMSSKPGHTNPKSKKVRVLGIDFDCMKYAAEAFGVNYSTLRTLIQKNKLK